MFNLSVVSYVYIHTLLGWVNLTVVSYVHTLLGGVNV